MVFVVIGAVLLGVVVFAGGGHTLTGLGEDMKTTGERVQGK